MVLRDPEAYQLLADETRRKMLYLLRVKEMTANQIAEELGITSQAVYHHIKKLLKGNMIEVTREERMGHLIESYYSATAEDFLLSHGKVKSETLHDRIRAQEEIATVLSTLKKLGFNLKFDEKKIAELADLRVRLDECCPLTKKSDIEDRIWDADDLNLLARVTASEFAGTLLMSDDEFEKQQENRKKLRSFLLSLVKKEKKPISLQPSVPVPSS